MRHLRFPVTAALFLLLAPALPAQERDLREQYGTKSLEAAKSIQRAIQLSAARKHKEALAAIDEAIKLDKGCPLAHFQRALYLSDLGQIEEAIDAYKTVLGADVRHSQNISATAAVNLGITYAKLKENDEAHLWLTRAILEDWDNTFKQRGKAYRNLAISLGTQNKNLAAALAVALAYQDRAPNCDLRMVRQYFDKAEGQEGARLLHFPDKVPAVAKRAQEAKLDPVTLDKIADPVTELLTDPEGRYVVALSKGASQYHLIMTADKPAVTKVELAKAIVTGCLAGGHLYAVADSPVQVEKIDVLSGKVRKTWTLKGVTAAPTSLAAFPAQGRAYFASPGEQVVYEVDLKTGNVAKTSVPGQAVVGHPNQRYLYSYVKPDRKGGEGGRIIIDGQRMYFNRTFDWLQGTLFQSVVVPRGLLLAGVRDNAASNAFRMSLSPDGNWVAMAGGGGYRPSVKGADGGYGVAVFSAHDLEHGQGFFATDAYPQGVCFNPVTGQVAAIRNPDAKVYHLSSPKEPVVLKGNFSGAGAWSGNGRFLVLGNNAGPGVTVFENALSKEEEKAAGAWFKAIKVVPVAPPQTAVASFEAVPELANFALATPSREELTQALAKAIEKGRTSRPGRWEGYTPYAKEDAPRKVIADVLPLIAGKMDLGIAIFQLKKALKATPTSVPAQFFLAEAQRLNDQAEDAEPNYVAVVRADQGRTELSLLALNHLAAMKAAKDQGMTALHCLVTALALDKARPQTVGQLKELLKKNKFDEEAEKVAKLPTAAGGPVVSRAELPKLPKPGEGKKMSAADIYQKAITSVVLIKTGSGTGSGVCVGSAEFILTNNHVVGEADDVEVYTFTVKDKAPVRQPAVRGSVVFRSPKEDVAVLKLEKAPEHLLPLLVAEATPNAGEKVYAVGSPGLGKEVLEQSISEGLVSAKRRLLDEVPYLQHSAAVNPGNSGGPLLDDMGRVVGIVTLKARLENVSFAIPPETVRTIFKSR
jgi:S1-C subfamily serine protease/Tfp pilus assembly protein PilF